MKAALVLETNNEDDPAALELLLRGLAPQVASIDELVITHASLAADDRARLERAAARAIVFVELASADYYDAKNAGFAATRADIVAFGDSDCLPAPEWLECLVAPFATRDARVVAGRTTYARHALSNALTAIDFTMFPLEDGRVRHFFANNVAFRRDVFAARPYTKPAGTRRGACGALAFRLRREGIPIDYAHGAWTRHALPETWRDWAAARRSRGRDLATLAPALADTHLPRALRWAGHLGGASTAALLCGRAVTSVRALERPRVRDAAAIVGITLLDASGAIR
jgi:hypothetical protein